MNGRLLLQRRPFGRGGLAIAAVAGVVGLVLPPLPAGAVVPAAYADASAVTIDPAGSMATSPTAINAGGEVAGYYLDASSVQHGFVDLAGTITTIDPAGSTATSPTAINAGGDVAGHYTDSSSVEHGFIDMGGTVTTVDPPGSTGTFVQAINSAGVIAGSFLDASSVEHGFVDAAGSFTTIDPAGSTGTEVAAIDAGGDVAGAYADASNVEHGFVDLGGTITSVDPSGTTATFATALNASGDVAGTYFDASFTEHGFVDHAGTITTVDPSGSTSTFVAALNTGEALGGSYNDASFVEHGFVDMAGTYTTIDPSGSTDTQVSAINDAGVVAGTYSAGGAQHGFVLSPSPVFTAANPPLSVNAGTTYHATFAATGATALAYSLAGAPVWLSIDPVSGIVVGTPPAGLTTFSYQVTAADTFGSSTTVGPFTVVVTSGWPASLTGPSKPAGFSAQGFYLGVVGNNWTLEVSQPVRFPGHLYTATIQSNNGVGFFTNVLGIQLEGDDSVKVVGRTIVFSSHDFGDIDGIRFVTSPTVMSLTFTLSIDGKPATAAQIRLGAAKRPSATPSPVTFTR